jgi:hypothetical protein
MTKKISISMIPPMVLSIICVVYPFWILPVKCELFGSKLPGPQECHTIPQSKYCYENYCQDRKTESIASIIAGFGVCLFIMSFGFHLNRGNFNKSVEKLKFFE